MAAGLEESPLDVPLERFGAPDEIVTTAVDVRAHLATKRQAMAAHTSQLPVVSYLLDMPDAVFERVWDHEWFIRRGRAPERRETSLFEGLEPNTAARRPARWPGHVYHAQADEVFTRNGAEG